MQFNICRPASAWQGFTQLTHSHPHLRYHSHYSIIVLSHVFPTLSTTQHWYWIILSQNLVGGTRENSETTRMTANFWLWAENRTSNNRWEQTSTHEQPSVVIVLVVHRGTPNSAAAVPTPSGSTDSTGVEGALPVYQSCKHQFLCTTRIAGITLLIIPNLYKLTGFTELSAVFS